jgi:hypothetical protein
MSWESVGAAARPAESPGTSPRAKGGRGFGRKKIAGIIEAFYEAEVDFFDASRTGGDFYCKVRLRNARVTKLKVFGCEIAVDIELPGDYTYNTAHGAPNVVEEVSE